MRGGGLESCELFHEIEIDSNREKWQILLDEGMIAGYKIGIDCISLDGFGMKGMVRLLSLALR